MRILHVTDHYLPALGGIEAHVGALASRQAARGDDVTVLTSTSRSADGKQCLDDGPVTVLRARNAVDGARLDFASYDVVHAHVSVIAPFAAPLAALASRQRVPTVVTVHSLWSGLGPVPTTAAALSGLLSAPVLWTAVSRVAARQVSMRLPDRPPVRVLPNAVAVGARERTPDPRGGDAVHLVSTMRLARRKRPMKLLGIFDSLRRSVSVPVALTIIGDGPQRSAVERRVRRLGLQDAVEVTGRLEPADVLGRLAVSDLYVAPAVLESFGLAALEARCVGLPVVGHAASGLTEFVGDGIEGRLCESDAGMVQALRELVENPSVRHEISEHNRTTPSAMTWPHALQHNDAAYADVRAARRRSLPTVVGG